jgi:hypothetical protein
MNPALSDISFLSDLVADYRGIPRTPLVIETMPAPTEPQERRPKPRKRRQWWRGYAMTSASLVTIGPPELRKRATVLPHHSIPKMERSMIDEGNTNG